MNHYVLVTWDNGKPLVRDYTDADEAKEIYRDAVVIRDHAYLYVTDDSGHMDLILDTERL